MLFFGLISFTATGANPKLTIGVRRLGVSRIIKDRHVSKFSPYVHEGFLQIRQVPSFAGPSLP